LEEARSRQELGPEPRACQDDGGNDQAREDDEADDNESDEQHDATLARMAMRTEPEMDARSLELLESR